MRISNFFLIFSLVFLLSCHLNPNQEITPNWSTNILGPLVKASLTTGNFNGIQKIEATQTIYEKDVFPANTPGTPVIVPAVSNVPVGTFTMDLTNAFTEAVFDSGQFNLLITNGFPIDIAKGTTLTFKQNGTTLTTYILPDSIAPGGTYNLNIFNLAGKTLYSQITLDISFSSDGSNKKFVTFNSNDYITIGIQVIDVKVNYILVKPGNSFTVNDTSNFQLSGDVIKASTVSGNFITHFSNSLPVEFNTQAYFLDENQQLIDSLFTSPILIKQSILSPACSTASSSITLDTVPYNSAKTNTLNNSRYVWLTFTVKSLGTCSPLIITYKDTMQVQIVGDLKLNVTN